MFPVGKIEGALVRPSLGLREYAVGVDKAEQNEIVHRHHAGSDQLGKSVRARVLQEFVSNEFQRLVDRGERACDLLSDHDAQSRDVARGVALGSALGAY